MHKLVSEARDKMSKCVKTFEDEIIHIRTGRASTAMFEGVMVDYYGTPTPLSQVAKMSIPEPTLIVAQPFDPSLMGAIEKAIRSSNLGLNPTNDGKVVRIPIPALTDERRKELSKLVHKYAE